MEIQLNDKYKLQSDNLQYKLMKKTTVKSGEDKGKEKWVNEGLYYTSLKGAFNGYLDYQLKRSDCQGLKEVMEKVEEIKAEINDVLDGIEEYE